MKTLKGNELSHDQQKEVLCRFVHRFTKTHIPQWALKPRDDGKPYMAQHETDADWLANTTFYVTKTGKLDNRHKFCESPPSLKIS